MTKDLCECGYFKYDCECCSEGKVCPVCGGVFRTRIDEGKK